MSEWRTVLSHDCRRCARVNIHDGYTVLVREVAPDIADRIIADHNASARLAALERALRDLIPFTEECIDAGYRDADVPIMMQWPPLNRARSALAAATAAPGSAEEPECTCGLESNTPTQHGAFCRRYGRLRGLAQRPDADEPGAGE